MLKKLGKPKFSYLTIKETTKGLAKAGGTCLQLNKFAILMPYKNWTLPKTL